MQKHFKRALSSILLAVVALTIGFAHNIAKAQAPVTPLADRDIHDIVAYFAVQYGTDPNTLNTVMDCESNALQSTVGDHGRANGIFQFWKGTWDQMTAEMGQKLDYHSGYDQAKVAAYAFAHGEGDQWTTYVALEHGGTYRFYSKSLHKSFTVTCKS